MTKFITILGLNIGLLLGAFPLSAQMFNQNTATSSALETKEKVSTQANTDSETTENTSSSDSPVALDLDMTKEEENEVINRLKKQLNPRIENGNLVLNPIDMGATADGSPRGTEAFISTNSKEGTEDGNIFLFYSNYQVSRRAATGIGCRVRFHILNGLNSRISNVSIKLVWPGLNTPLSFNNVNPNTENYFDYALFGEGCYQMDKIPNIVVNRCRVKGMSQEACANKIRWLTKR